jgi:hypothetical protein
MLRSGNLTFIKNARKALKCLAFRLGIGRWLEPGCDSTEMP